MSEHERRKRVVEGLPIAEFIGEYLPLHYVGAVLRSLCPFHDDQHPTLRIDSAARSFKCYDCGASGDVVDFVRMYERLTVSKALDTLESRLDPGGERGT
jgi:DNA primase